jgi:hypothetical protein
MSRKSLDLSFGGGVGRRRRFGQHPLQERQELIPRVKMHCPAGGHMLDAAFEFFSLYIRPWSKLNDKRSLC